jgi:hypothetical protein
MVSHLITDESAERNLGNERQQEAVARCINESASCQPVVHVRKDGTRLVTNGADKLYAVTRNGSVFSIDYDYTTEQEDEVLAQHADAIAEFTLAV